MMSEIKKRSALSILPALYLIIFLFLIDMNFKKNQPFTADSIARI